LRHSDNGGLFLHGQGDSAHLKSIIYLVSHQVDDAWDGAYPLVWSMCTILLLCAQALRFWVVEVR
jgi:hypothetical protein